MPKLTDTQRAILSAAAKRNGGTILPLPNTLKTNKGAAATSLKSLIKRGLIAERPAQANDTVWQETNSGKRLSLIITKAGLTAIGIDPTEAPADAESGADAKGTASIPGRAPSKQTMLLDLLHRADGASIDELSAVLGWQAHSVRGAIAGTVKKKLGFAVMSEKNAERGRVYRISAENAAGRHNEG